MLLLLILRRVHAICATDLSRLFYSWSNWISLVNRFSMPWRSISKIRVYVIEVFFIWPHFPKLFVSRLLFCHSALSDLKIHLTCFLPIVLAVLLSINVRCQKKKSCIIRFITTLLGMQTRSEMRTLSVCPSLRLFVKRVNCNKMRDKPVQIFIPYEILFILVFWEKEWLVGRRPLLTETWVNRPPLERNRRFWTDTRS